MFSYLKNLFVEARTKVTTYLALGAATFSELADNAQSLHDQLPQLKSYLPSGPRLTHICDLIASGLGILIVWSRVRRTLSPPKAQP